MWDLRSPTSSWEWWHGLEIDQQEALTDRIDLLGERGPDLGRPVAWPSFATKE